MAAEDPSNALIPCAPGQVILPTQLDGAPAWAELIVTRLNQLTASVNQLSNQLTTGFNQLNASVNQLRADVAALNTDVAVLQHATSEERTVAFINNSTCTSLNSPLVPVPHRETGAMPPPVFPATLGVFNELTDPHLSQLLTFYGLALDGNLFEKRTRLAQGFRDHLGALAPNELQCRGNTRGVESAQHAAQQESAAEMRWFEINDVTPVAGHLFEEGKAGSLVDDRGHFYKPIQPGPRGDRERAFYESILAAKSRDKAAWDQGKWSSSAIAAVQAIASGQQISQVLGLSNHHLSNGATNNGTTSPTPANTSHLPPLRPSSSPRATFSGAVPVPLSPSYLKAMSPTTSRTPPSATSSRTMKHFPTFRAEPSFRQLRGGMGAIIRDPIEVLERDEVGLIDQLVEEEWLPWSDDDDDEEEGEHGNGELGGDGGKSKAPVNLVKDTSNPEGIQIPLNRNDIQQGNGPSTTHNHRGTATGSDVECESDIDDNLRYSRSPDSVSDDGLESNTGQHVMDGVIVAHSNSLRNHYSTESTIRSSLDLKRESAGVGGADVKVGDVDAQHATTTVSGATTTATTSTVRKFIGNTPTRPLGSHRSGTGFSHKSTDSIDEALRLHALSLNTAKQQLPAGVGTPSSGLNITNEPILEENEKDESNANKIEHNQGQTRASPFASSSSAVANWHDMPFTVRNAPLLRVIPKFYGVTHADDRTLLELEDLARWYRHPCIMDIKIGYRTWYAHAEPDYIERCRRKDASTTQASLGFKICGMQVYRHARGGYWRASKRWCKTLSEALVDKALASFANNEHGLRPSDVYGGDQGAVAQLRALESWFKVQKEFHLYSASLLLLYEGDAHGPEETNVRVRLVDFAHTFAVGQSQNGTANSTNAAAGTSTETFGNNNSQEGGIDDNFLSGLRSFASRLNAVSTMEYVADTLITTAGR